MLDKIPIAFASLVVLLALCAGCKDDDMHAPPQQEILEIVPSIIEMGNVKNSDSFTHRIAIRNHGTEPVVIGRIRTSCSCVLFKPEKTVVPPGESITGHLSLELNTQQAGPFRYVIQIGATDTTSRSLFLTVKGVAEHSFHPTVVPRVVRLGSIAPDESRAKSVTIYVPVHDGYRYKGTRTAGKYCIVREDMVSEDKVALTVTCPADYPPGRIKERIEVDLDKKILSFDVLGNKMANLVTVPSEIFVDVSGQRQTEHQILVESKAKERLSFVELHDPNERFRLASFNRRTTSILSLSIKYVESKGLESGKSESGTIKIRTNLGDAHLSYWIY
jgi:hypothetical protein